MNLRVALLASLGVSASATAAYSFRTELAVQATAAPPSADGSGSEDSGDYVAAPTPAPTLADNGYLSGILLKDNFTTWFSPNPVYSYEGLAAAAAEFFDGEFLSKKGDTKLRKREFAAFISHAVAESSLKELENNGTAGSPDGAKTLDTHCDRTYVSCAAGKSYHARGPFLMTGNENYARCSAALGLKNLLLMEPERVASDPKLAWGSAICLWMRDDGLGSLHARALDPKQGFAATTALLKGAVECGAQPLKAGGDAARVTIYNTTCTNLQIKPDDNMYCSPRPADPTAAPPKPAANASASAKALQKLLPQDAFEALFNSTADLYHYEDLVEAVAEYPEFLTSANESDDNALELAAFLAQASVATKGFSLRVAPYADKYAEEVFCDSNLAPCLDGRNYYGRGAFLVEWNYNYARLGDDLDLELLKNPDVLAKDGVVNWRVALHMWMTDLGRGRPHDYVGRAALLAQASNVLFGDRVCSTSPRDPKADAARIDAYLKLAAKMGVKVSSSSQKALSCKTIAFDPPAQVTGLDLHFSEADFAAAFPKAAPHFAYATLLEAAQSFPKFANEGAEEYDKHEIAAFLAHAAVMTANFTRREAANAALYAAEDFCDRQVGACVKGKRYHGRGAFHMAWNYNYAKCGDFIGVDLLQNPEYVYLDSIVAWKAALWYWMEYRPLSPYGSPHKVMHRHLDSFEENFRLTTTMIGGEAVCGSDDERQRVELFNQLSAAMNVDKGDVSKLQCGKPAGDASLKAASTKTQAGIEAIVTTASYYDIVGGVANIASLYDYRSFLFAASAFPAFAGSVEDERNRREVAGFFAHVSASTMNFQLVEDKAAAAKCSKPPCFYRRGPLMISGEKLYLNVSRTLDKDLTSEPEMVATESDVAWQSALYLWMADHGQGSVHESYRLSDFGFASSVQMLAPALCAKNASSDALDTLVKKYEEYCKALGVEPEKVVSCQDEQFESYDAAKMESEKGTGGLAAIMSKEMFQQLFPMADPLYTYSALLDATAKFPKFANDGPDRQNRQEVAAFVAQMAHASGNFTFTQQASWNLYKVKEFCDEKSNYTCVANMRYHGRGPIQLTWNYNYGMYGKEIGVDLLSNPDWVATDSKIAWGSAIWYWMLDQQAGRGSLHDIFVRGTADGFDYDFARTTFLLNGGNECGDVPKYPEPEAQRIRYFKKYAAHFHVEPGTRLSCHSNDYPPPKE